jgi:hypothetical protein
MKLWKVWYEQVQGLRGSCSRLQTFLWMVTVLAGFSIRDDLAGVTSFVRCLALHEGHYYSLLRFFHSSAVDLEKLRMLWVGMCLTMFKTSVYRVRGKPVTLADGFKNPKEGRKMPAVRSLHQESNNNTKPAFIMGHYFECISLLVQKANQAFAVPLVSNIHDGVIFNKEERKRTLIDKFIVLMLATMKEFYVVADAYYAARKVMTALKQGGGHLITRMKGNAVAWTHPNSQCKEGRRNRGRPRIYGDKVHLGTLFNSTEHFTGMPSPVYGEKNVEIQYRVLDLLLRPFAIEVRIVLVIHPNRGKIILVSTDRDLSAFEIIKLFGLRFKIEVGFRHATRVLGIYAYHFWMSNMEKISRGTKSQEIYNRDEKYQNDVRRKLHAYHLFAQLGLIAQGLLIYISVYFKDDVWRLFGSWMRTMKTQMCPSELVVTYALRSSFWVFLWELPKNDIWKKFVKDKVAFGRLPGVKRA